MDGRYIIHIVEQLEKTEKHSCLFLYMQDTYHGQPKHTHDCECHYLQYHLVKIKKKRERERDEKRDDRRENRVTVHTTTRRPTRRPTRHVRRDNRHDARRKCNKL